LKKCKFTRTSAWLQWGRSLFAADIQDFIKPIKWVEMASMGPQLICCGYVWKEVDKVKKSSSFNGAAAYLLRISNDSLDELADIVLLQWGRS
jgi:hypothetical protein